MWRAAELEQQPKLIVLTLDPFQSENAWIRQDG
jgi:hypothetical protein